MQPYVDGGLFQLSHGARLSRRFVTFVFDSRGIQSMFADTMLPKMFSSSFSPSRLCPGERRLRCPTSPIAMDGLQPIFHSEAPRKASFKTDNRAVERLARSDGMLCWRTAISLPECASIMRLCGSTSLSIADCPAIQLRLANKSARALPGAKQPFIRS